VVKIWAFPIPPSSALIRGRTLVHHLITRSFLACHPDRPRTTLSLRRGASGSGRIPTMIRITTPASGSSLETVLTTASPLRGGAGIYACGRSHKISGFSHWGNSSCTPDARKPFGLPYCVALQNKKKTPGEAAPGVECAFFIPSRKCVNLSFAILQSRQGRSIVARYVSESRRAGMRNKCWVSKRNVLPLCRRPSRSAKREATIMTKRSATITSASAASPAPPRPPAAPGSTFLPAHQTSPHRHRYP
jgi:hypothetical protein